MKLSRISPCLIAIILIFALMATSAQMSNAPKKNTPEPIPSAQQQPPKTVTVILHGLMVGRYKGGNKKRFEVGIVKRAPDHIFCFHLYVPGQNSCAPIPTPQGHNWVFEVRKNNNTRVDRNIEMWRPPVCQSDKEPLTEISAKDILEDSDHILDIEREVHTGKAGRYKKAFKPTFYFHHGKVKTHTLTVPLLTAKVETDGEVCWKRIGPIAEVVKVEIQVEHDQQLVLRNRNDEANANPSWRLEYNNILGAVEVRILHLPSPSHNVPIPSYNPCDDPYNCKNPYKGGPQCDPDKSKNIDINTFLKDRKNGQIPCTSNDEDIPATHFQFYYYLVFEKDRPDRFELKPESVVCQNVTKDGAQIMTVPPYRCGMVMVKNNSNDIETKQ